MPSRLEILSSYVPTLALRRLEQNPAPLAQAVEEKFQAAVLFADLSGFTTLADRLAQHNGVGIPHGAEELAHLLNLYFGQLIEIIYEHGGDVTEFAGDALLAIWPVKDSTGLAEAAAKAAQCALTAQACLNNYPVATNTPLSLRVGLGIGEVTAMHVGGAFGHWKIFMSGSPVVQAILAQQKAEPGRVVLSPETQLLVHRICTGTLLPDHSMILLAVRASPPTASASRGALKINAEIGLLSYLPGAIVSRLLSGYHSDAEIPQAEWLAELRHVTVLFINLPGLTETSSVESIQRVVRGLQTILYRYECSLNKVGLSETGLVMVGALGLPPLAHEDDALRALYAAFALQDEMQAMDLECFIGVTSGMAFCGSVGNELRREYTLIGDVVNVASRFMHLALQVRQPSEHSVILCDSATYQTTANRLSFKTIPPVTVKGKATPLDVYCLLRDRLSAPRPLLTAAGQSSQIVGRESEINILHNRLQQLQQDGVGGVLIFQGESGIGKSRLLEEAKKIFEGSRFSTYTLVGDPLERATPYRAWRTAFSRLLDLDVLNTPAFRQAHVLSLLEIWQDHDLDQLAPLLNVVLPLDLPDTDTTRPLSGQARAEATCRLLCEILRISASSSAKVFLIEDAHWLDSKSWNLVLELAQSAAHQNILFIIALRPFAEEVPLSEYISVRDLAATVQVDLHPLSASESFMLARNQWGVEALSPAVANLMLEKTEGNPFYIAELTFALRDSGLVSIQDGECRAVHGTTSLNYLHFPNTIQGVITSRIDRLPPPQQLALKVASIIGREFTFSVLSAVYPVAEDLPRLPDYLHEMERLELIKMDPEAPELTYSFKHILTQEATYNLMLFSQRRDLHRQIGQVIERLHGDRLSDVFGVLGRHFLHGETWDKAYRYMVLAGDAALHLNAEADARFCYAQSLESLKHLASSPQNHRHFRDVVLKYVTLSWSVTPLARSLELLFTAESLLRLLPTTEAYDSNDVASSFQIELWIARLQLCRNDYLLAIDRLHLLLPRLRDFGDTSLLVESQICLGQALIVQGKFAEAASHLDEARSLLGEDRGEDMRQIQVLALLGVVTAALTPPGQRAAPKVSPLPHWTESAFVHTYLALSAALNNDFAALLEDASRVIELARKVENPFYLHLGYNLRGWGEILAGDTLKAQESFRLAEVAGKDLGERLLFAHWFTPARSHRLLPLLSTLSKSKEHILLLASAEPLVGVNDRHNLFEPARHEFDVAVRYQNPLSVILFDLDRFKQANTMVGPMVNSQLLERVTQVALTQLRSTDMLGRYGDKKLIMLLPMTEAEQAYIVAERFRANLAALYAETNTGHSLVTLSLGIAEVVPTRQDESVGNVIERADQALEMAKANGGDCTTIFERVQEVSA